MALPDDFFWGCGASSVAIEGAARRSDWFRWEEHQHLPRSADGNGFATRFTEDFELFAENGLRHLRITVEWARLEPVGGQIERDEAERLLELFTAARDAGLHPWATLQHGSLPGWFADDTDGFVRTGGPSIHWSRYVDRVAELLDGLAVGWIPIEDPIGWAIGGHAVGNRPPGRASVERARDAAEGALEATFEACKLLSSGAAPVVSSFGLPTLHDRAPEATAARRDWEEAIWHSWIRAIGEGVLQWPWRAPVEREDMADAFDAIGIGARPPMGVTAEGTFAPWPRGDRVDASGFAPNPQELGEVLHRVDELLPGRDLVITGLGVGTDDDPWRDDLHMGWLDQLTGAVSDGVGIRGVFFEPAIDGYSLDSGFDHPGGLFTRDREPKPSYRWIEAQIARG